MQEDKTLSTVARATKRAMAHQIFHELMADEFSHERFALSRQQRRKLAWIKAKLIANGFVNYADHKANERSSAKADLVKAEPAQAEKEELKELIEAAKSPEEKG
jgi:hypothetical protein